jgi:hypothetical protein
LVPLKHAGLPDALNAYSDELTGKVNDDGQPTDDEIHKYKSRS